MNGGYGIPERLLRIGIALVVVFLLLVVLVIWIATQNAEVLTNPKALSHIIELILIYAALAAGMSLVLAAGEADLSVGGVVSLAAIVAAGLVTNIGLPGPVALIIVLGLGLLIGLVNGLLITGLRLPFYIVTLTMWGLTLGLSTALGRPQGMIWGGKPLEWSWLLLLVLNLIVYGLGVVALLLLGHLTSLGKLTSLNARSEAEGRPGGVALGLYKIGAYTISGLLAAVAGLAFLNLTRATFPGSYSDMTVMALAAAVIGGVPLWKGATRLLGAVLGSAALVLLAQAIVVAQLRNTVQISNVLAWAGLALLVAILWGAAGWVLDLIFGKSGGGER